MPITVDLAQAATRLEALLATAEAGEEVIIFRNGAPVARLTAFDADRHCAAIEKTIADVRALRAHARPVTAEEFVASKNEGRR